MFLGCFQEDRDREVAPTEKGDGFGKFHPKLSVNGNDTFHSPSVNGNDRSITGYVMLPKVSIAVENRFFT